MTCKPSMRPLCIDLYCGLGGWAEGFLAENYRVVGFDIERHDYGTGGYPGQLVLQDALTLHGSQFKDAAVIVASPPCQKYSYMAMPWSRAKEQIKHYEASDEARAELTALFDCCFRIQREASEAAGRHIPLIVENVRGAQRWVGRAKWHFGSYFLWGDLPALMPIRFGGVKVAGISWSGYGEPGYEGKAFNGTAAERCVDGTKTIGHVNQRDGHTHTRHLTNQAESAAVGIKQHGSGREWFAGEGKISRVTSSHSHARKAASAQIAKIPFPLANHIAKCFRESLIAEEGEE